MRKPLTFILLAALLLLPGCAGRGTSAPAEAAFTVVTSFYPMYIETINVARDVPGVRVVNMTRPQTGCLHDYQLTPDDLKTLESADAFVVNGAGMESFLQDVIDQHKGLAVVEASRGIELYRDATGELNAHLWVSVTNCIAQVRNIAAQLAALDKANAARYAANADAYIAKLEALKTEMHARLDGKKNREIITFHEAFAYFAKEFNLDVAAVIEREPGTDPTPRELAGIIDTVKQTGIKALFAEPQYSTKAAEAIARETGATVYTLDPGVTGEAKPDAYDAYIDVMKQNLDELDKALQ